MNAFSKKRWATQPAAPSAGCMFKNPATIPAGMRAVAVKVNEIVGVAGFAVPGMRVDVLISGKDGSGT